MVERAARAAEQILEKLGILDGIPGAGDARVFNNVYAIIRKVCPTDEALRLKLIGTELNLATAMQELEKADLVVAEVERLRKDVKRLISANEHWHTRVRQLKLEVEAYADKEPAAEQPVPECFPEKEN